MIVTEEEAKTKWCPEMKPKPEFTRLDIHNNKVISHLTCVSTQCMWWIRVAEKKGQCGRAAV